MVDHVGERRFEAQPVSFTDAEHLGQGRIHVDQVWPFQNAEAAGAKPSSVWRRKREYIDVKEISGGPI